MYINVGNPQKRATIPIFMIFVGGGGANWLFRSLFCFRLFWNRSAPLVLYYYIIARSALYVQLPKKIPGIFCVLPPPSSSRIIITFCGRHLGSVTALLPLGSLRQIFWELRKKSHQLGLRNSMWRFWDPYFGYPKLTFFGNFPKKWNPLATDHFIENVMCDDVICWKSLFRNVLISIISVLVRC